MKRFKKTQAAILLISSLGLVGCQSTAERVTQDLSTNTVDVNDKVTAMKRGVVLMSDQVKVTAGQLRQQSGQLSTGLITAGAATAAVGGLSGDEDAAAVGGVIALAGLLTMAAESSSDKTQVDATRYTIQLADNDSVIEIFQIDQFTIPDGSPVFVRSYQSGKVQITLDRTQHRQYNRAKDTNFVGDEVRKAEKAAAKAKAQADREWEENQKRRRIEAETRSLEKLSEKTESIIDAHNKGISKGKQVNILR